MYILWINLGLVGQWRGLKELSQSISGQETCTVDHSGWNWHTGRQTIQKWWLLQSKMGACEMQWTPKRCERRKIDELKKNGGETPGLKVHVQREQVVKNGDVDAIWTPIGMDVWWSLQGSATKQGDDSGFANEVVMLFLIVTIALPFTSQGSVWCYPMLHASYLVAGDIPMLLVVVCILHHPTENGGPIPRHVRIGETKRLWELKSEFCIHISV